MTTNGRWWLLKLNFVFLALCFMGTSTCESQGVDLEYINIQDSVLVDKIMEYIELRQQEFPYFRDMGYLELELIYSNRYGGYSKVNDSLKAVFSLEDAYTGFEDWKYKFPKYFTYINSKLVLIYLVDYLISDDSKISQKSRNLLVDLTVPILEPVEELISKDSLGNIVMYKKYFRPDEYVMLHTGRNIKIYKDGTMELSH